MNVEDKSLLSCVICSTVLPLLNAGSLINMAPMELPVLPPLASPTPIPLSMSNLGLFFKSSVRPWLSKETNEAYRPKLI